LIQSQQLTNHTPYYIGDMRTLLGNTETTRWIVINWTGSAHHKA